MGFPGHSDTNKIVAQRTKIEVSIPNGLPRPFRRSASNWTKSITGSIDHK